MTFVGKNMKYITKKLLFLMTLLRSFVALQERQKSEHF